LISKQYFIIIFTNKKNIMKNFLLLTISLFLINISMAQITIDQTDMPIAKDSSVRVNASNGATFNFATTGANTVWDFSTLTFVNSTTETYSDISGAPGFTQLIFNSPFNQNAKSQIFKTGQNPLQSIPGLPLTVGNTLEFYKKTATRYARTGYSLNLNGIDLPLPFDSNDIEYKLPMNFGNVDSCLSVFQINSPFLSFLYYKTRQKRVNQVDGWGKLKLPNGFEYDVLRIKSTLYTVDTFHVDTFVSFGFQLPMRKTIEYKWLAKGLQAPILVASGLEIAGNWTPTTIRYLNKNALALQDAAIETLTIEPTVANDFINIHLANKVIASVCIYDQLGKLVLTQKLSGNANHTPIILTSLTSGNYIISARCNNGAVVTGKFVKQ
jgi:Secretion system C-terminal sorting domain